MKSHKANHLNTQFPTSNFNNQIPIENLETEGDNIIRRVTAKFSTNLKAGNITWLLDMDRNLRNKIKGKSEMPNMGEIHQINEE